jgi:hypothetical protein
MPNSDEVAVSTRIEESVAAAEGVDPLSLSPPLGDVLDVGALDALCEEGSDVTVSFVAWGRHITVDGDRISVGERRVRSAAAD